MTALELFKRRVREFSTFFEKKYSHEELIQIWKNLPPDMKEMYRKEAKEARTVFNQNALDVAAKESVLDANVETSPTALRKLDVDSENNAICQSGVSKENEPVTGNSCNQDSQPVVSQYSTPMSSKQNTVSHVPMLLLEMLNTPTPSILPGQQFTSSV